MAIVQTLIPYGVLVAQLLFVAILIIWGNNFSSKKWVATHAKKLSLLVVTVASLASMYYSNVLNFVPCNLCWYQRIFIFSMIPLFAVSLCIKKSKEVYWYGIASAGIAFVIALYHYITQFFGTATSCGIGEAAGSCAGKYVFHFGYMTIPVMAMTACALVVVFCVIAIRSKK